MCLIARPVSHTDVCDRLDSGDVDLAISVFGALRPWHCSQVLYEQAYGCLFDPAKWGKTVLDLQDYVSSRQVIVTYDGELRGKIDRVLDGLGMQRDVGHGTTRIATLPFLVKDCRLVASLPKLIGKRLAQTHALAYCPLPFTVPPGLPRMAWHSRNDTDAANLWLRGLVEKCVAHLGAPSGKWSQSDPQHAECGRLSQLRSLRFKQEAQSPYLRVTEALVQRVHHVR